MIDIKIDIARTPRNAIQRVGDVAEVVEPKPVVDIAAEAEKFVEFIGEIHSSNE